MKKTILYLDDDAECLNVFEEMFGKEFDVRVALTPEEARRMLAERPADIIISDQIMPGSCGTDFLREVAAGPAQNYRVLLTGSSLMGSVIAEIGSGVVNTFITKPWTRDDIHSVLERAEVSEDENNRSLARRTPGGMFARGTNRALSSGHTHGR